MTLCTRKRRCKSEEDSTMYLFPALSEAPVVGKNEKACVSVPIFIFTRYVTSAGHATFLRAFSPPWNENGNTGQLWRVSELVHLSQCTFLSPIKTWGHLCSREGIWRDGSGHWVTEMRTERRESTMAASRGDSKCLSGHPRYRRYVFLCM